MNMAFVPRQDMVMDHMMYMLTGAKKVYTVLKLYFKRRNSIDFMDNSTKKYIGYY